MLQVSFILDHPLTKESPTIISLPISSLLVGITPMHSKIKSASYAPHAYFQTDVYKSHQRPDQNIYEA